MPLLLYLENGLTSYGVNKTFPSNQHNEFIIRQAMYIKHNIKERSHNHCCHANAISITYSECASVSLNTQHAKRMCGVILSSVVCPVLYFCILSHKRHDFRGKEVIEHKAYVLIFPTAFVLNISYFKKNSVREYHKCTQIFM
jgi:hypothetical protein